MNQYQQMYQDKSKTPEEIADLFQSGYVCACPSALGQPTVLVEKVGERARKGELEGVVHHGIISQPGAAFLEKELAGKYYHVSWFTSGSARPGVQNGWSDFLPCNYSQVPWLYEEYLPKLDVLYATVSPMDEHGYFSFGLAGSEPEALVRKAEHIYLEVNKNMPRIFGTNVIHISQVEALCEHDCEIPQLLSAPLGENDIKMGEMIAELIPDGATVQFGIGGVPNAVGQCLLKKKDLGIHTEMFTDSMVDLIEAGAVTNQKKTLNRGKTVASFAWGSKRMYDFMHENMSIEMHPVSYVNDPYTIGQFDHFISVNSCMEVDLLGQVCAESIGPKNFSGTGGQADFVRGCANSKGGKSFIAFNSTAKKDTISKIKPILTPGAAVTTTKNDVDYIVTEYGVVRLRGLSAGQRAKALISIAHPKFREKLLAEAKKMNLMV